MYYVYILKSKKNASYYIGSCKNLQDRITKHNKGLVKSTKRYVPWEKVYHEIYPTLKEARKREKQIKSWKKRSAIEKLINKSKFK